MDLAACVDVLLDAAPEARNADRAELAAAVADLLARAAPVDDPVGLCAHVGARLPAGVDPVAALGGLAARDLAVAFGCLRGDADALAELERDHLAAARPALARMGASAAIIDEQLQAVRARLLVGDGERPARIADYRGHGGLRRWVRAAAVHHYLNQVRDGKREVGVEDDDVLDALAEPGTDPQLAYLKQRYRAVFADAVVAAAGQLDPVDRAVLRYTHVDNLNLDALGRALRVSRATAHRRLTAARAALLAATERELEARLELTPEEVMSMHRLVRSQLELSMGRIFHR
jgi:RNA polymerase sigma-70 factor (ECF subfamily)